MSCDDRMHDSLHGGHFHTWRVGSKLFARRCPESLELERQARAAKSSKVKRRDEDDVSGFRDADEDAG